MTSYARTAGNAGLIVTRRSRQTGELVSLYDAAAASIATDDESCPYVVVCERHATLQNAPTKKEGEAWIAAPLEWCGYCRGDEEFSEEEL